MDVGRTLYVTTAKAWRAWLRRNHAKRPDIWLVYYRKETGKPRISYNDAVDEALCFGWIDSLVKSLGAGAFAQRFSPRKKGSNWSAANRARVRRLLQEKRMTPAGLAALPRAGTKAAARTPLRADVRSALKKDGLAWKNFQRFPAAYKEIRLFWIEAARKRPKAFRQRLRYFVKMTHANKQFGMVRG